MMMMRIVKYRIIMTKNKWMKNKQMRNKQMDIGYNYKIGLVVHQHVEMVHKHYIDNVYNLKKEGNNVKVIILYLDHVMNNHVKQMICKKIKMEIIYKLLLIHLLLKWLEFQIDIKFMKDVLLKKLILMFYKIN